MVNRFGNPEDRMQASDIAASCGVVSWTCHRCGSTEWRGEDNTSVNETRHPSDEQVTKRVRICRKCQQVRVDTQEAYVPKGYKLKVVPDEGSGERACA